MTSDEQLLLENLLDAFDRLHDRAAQVVDIQALLVATAKALPGAPLTPELESSAKALMSIMRSRKMADEEANESLDVLQPLRERLAAALP